MPESALENTQERLCESMMILLVESLHLMRILSRNLNCGFLLMEVSTSGYVDGRFLDL